MGIIIVFVDEELKFRGVVVSGFSSVNDVMVFLYFILFDFRYFRRRGFREEVIGENVRMVMGVWG